MNREIVDYIRKNITTYSRQAIEKELTQHGFSLEEIQEAWEEANRTNRNYVVRNREDNKGFWLAFFGFFLGMSALIVLNSWIGSPINFVQWGYLGTIIATIVLWNKRRGVAKGLLAAMLCSVALLFVLLIILIGICIFASGNSYRH